MTIRGMLVLTMLLAIFLGYRTNIARREQPALALLREHGCTPRYRHDIFGNLPSFAPQFVREAIGVENFASVVRLNFADDSPTSDKAFSMLDRLPNVTTVNTDGAQISDAGLAPIANLTRLTCLRLNGATKISDRGLKHLSQLVELDLLSLSGTTVTDQGLGELSDLSNLEILNLNNTLVSDRGIMELRHMKGLQLLRVQGTNVTATGAAELQEELPECQIEF